jgi:hypothetical protein
MLSESFWLKKILSDEEDDDDVQNDDIEEDTTFIPEVPDPYEKVYSK